MTTLLRNPLSEKYPSPETSLSVGDRVVVNDIYTGTIRYIGRVGTKKHKSFGIELDSPIGDNDGSRAGRVYFSCKSRHGVFREFKEVRKYAPLDYNQTGIINTTEIEEIPNPKAVSELLNDNVEIQRKMEDLVKENLSLKNEIKKKDLEIEALERILKSQTDKENGLRKEEDSQESVQSHSPRKSVIIDIVSEIINSIKEKIETENRIFNINNKA